MEKKDYLLEECGYRSVATSLGEMFVGYDEWEEMEEMANEVGGEIYLLKKRNGERVYQTLSRQHDKHDRVDDYNDKCVDIFYYDEWEGNTIRDVYHTCFKHRLEEAMSHDEEGVDDIIEILKEFNRAKKYIEDYLTSEDSILTIDEYLSCDVIERYPTIWHEDVYEYRMALKLPTED